MCTPPTDPQGFKALSDQGQADAQQVARQQRTLTRLGGCIADTRRRAAVTAGEAETGNEALSLACAGSNAELAALACRFRAARDAARDSLEGSAGAARGAGRALGAHVALVQRILGVAEQVRLREAVCAP